MTIDRPYVMTPLEIAAGMPFEAYEVPRSSEGAARRNPRDVLEEIVRSALESPPCGIAFSGGRDSSLVLAVAVHVARREGLPEPVPLTKVFPSAEGTDEREWQELVLQHLGMRDWERVVLHDELDLIGPLAQVHLREFGVVWSPAAHASLPLCELVRGGTLLDGGGGDEVLGVERHRIAPVSRLVRSRGRRHRRAALRALRHRRLRARDERLRLGTHGFPWLQPAARNALVRSLVDSDVRRPLSFAASVELEPARRTRRLAEQSKRAVSARYGVEIQSPLLATDFVAALAARKRWLGPGDRTAVIGALAGDLLPSAVVARRTKAEFSGVYWGLHTREFVDSWAGGGVDPALVDADELRRLWTSRRPHAMTSALLQTAWLNEVASIEAVASD